MSDYLASPNIEAIVSSELRAANIVDVGVRWYSSIPATPTYPLGVVRRIGGTPVVREYLDAPNIQIDVWGGTKAQAFNIASLARVICMRLSGRSFTSPARAFVSGVEDSLGLTWLPDELTGRDRYIFSLNVYAHV